MSRAPYHGGKSVIYGSPDTLTGGYLYDRIVAEGLRRLGHEVAMIGLAGSSAGRNPSKMIRS